MDGEDQQQGVQQPPRGILQPLGESILNVFGAQSEKQRQEEQQNFFTDIQAAGSREVAHEVVRNYAAKFKTANDIATAFRAVDEFYPEASKEVKDVNIYHKQTGQEARRFVSSADVSAINDPAELERRFGPEWTLTKPLTTGASAAADADRDRQFARSTLEKAAHMSALSLNGRQLPDGSFTFDDDNKAKLFNERLRYMEELIKTKPNIMMQPNGFVALHTNAAKALPLISETDRPPEEPKPKPKGAVSEFVDRVLGRDKKPSGESADEKPAEDASVKAAVEKVPGWKYEPKKYEYRVGPGGKVQRRLKNG